jgi:hypothetical protein
MKQIAPNPYIDLAIKAIGSVIAITGIIWPIAANYYSRKYEAEKVNDFIEAVKPMIVSVGKMDSTLKAVQFDLQTIKGNQDLSFKRDTAIDGKLNRYMISQAKTVGETMNILKEVKSQLWIYQVSRLDTTKKNFCQNL